MHPAAMREVSEQVSVDSGRWMDGAGEQPPAVDGAGRRVELGEGVTGAARDETASWPHRWWQQQQHQQHLPSKVEGGGRVHRAMQQCARPQAQQQQQRYARRTGSPAYHHPQLARSDPSLVLVLVQVLVLVP